MVSIGIYTSATQIHEVHCKIETKLKKSYAMDYKFVEVLK